MNTMNTSIKTILQSQVMVADAVNPGWRDMLSTMDDLKENKHVEDYGKSDPWDYE